MKRAIAACLLVIAVGAGIAGPAPTIAATPEGAITWTVDHSAKTITAMVKLTIYSACSGDPQGEASDKARACFGKSSVTQLLADRIKAKIESLWNKPYYYRCYKLIFRVEIKLAPDRQHADPDRITVRIDPSPAAIRDFVNAGNDQSKYASDDPADRIQPTNDGDHVSTWSEAEDTVYSTVYAHEFGHILGLHDGYFEEKQVAYRYPDAPDDLMSTMKGQISQTTIDRLVKRNLPLMRDAAGQPVTDADFVCDLQLTIGDATVQQTIAAGPVTLTYDLTLKLQPDAPIKLAVAQDGTVSGSSDVILEGPAKVAVCSGTYKSTEKLMVEGTKTTAADGTVRVTLRISGQPGGGSASINCPRLGRTLDIPKGGGFANRWAMTIGELSFQLKTEGDTRDANNNGNVGGIPTHADGTFKLDYAASGQ